MILSSDLKLKEELAHQDSHTNPKSLITNQINIQESQPRHRLAKYVKRACVSRKINSTIFIIEFEGVPLKTRSVAKGITYFECDSHRQKNILTVNFED